MSDVNNIPRHDDSVLAARDVVTGYGELQILSGVDVDVRADEIVVLFGPNGAGKSTFVRAAYRLLPVWEGSIELRGQPISALSTQALISEGLSYIPQRNNTFPNLTVDENLDIGGLHVDAPDERKSEMYDLFSPLDGYRDREVSTLSGGERQMVAMARALMGDPDVLLVDEPSAGLAPQAVERTLAHIEEVNAAGTAVLIIEQNVKDALEIADRAYALDRGETRFEGPASTMLEDEQIRDLYI